MVVESGTRLPTYQSKTELNPRLSSHKEVLIRYRQTTKSIFERYPTNFDLQRNYFVSKVSRDLIASSGIRWSQIDALWGIFAPDGIAEDDKMQNLVVAMSKNNFAIQNPRENVSLFLGMNNQYSYFLPEIRPVDDKKEFKNPNLVYRAKDYLRQGVERNDFNLHIKMEYGRRYKLDDPMEIVRDKEDADTLLNALGLLIENDSLSYSHNDPMPSLTF